ncbi:hypothetical protein L6164_016503 [Bauhinia variegata]|uniref:Uncharacterized protein n=1 Tax=Bauhinia variegata TaxID=167791 RepID=A0ACB9NNY1_BAUVA|nr:hypothetical protein L6164_016503 [Bauhinia variegata]
MAEKTKISGATRDFFLSMKKEIDETPLGAGKARTVRCGNCKQSGHNRRTCQSAAGDVLKNESNRKEIGKQIVIATNRGKNEISLRNIAAGEGSSQKGKDMGKWLKL